jgi:hypothetical protein
MAYDNSTETSAEHTEIEDLNIPRIEPGVCLDLHLRRFADMASSVHTRMGMPTTPKNSFVDFGDAGAADVMKVGLAQQGFLRMDEQPSEETGIVAHMKVIVPMTSTGPSVLARVVGDSASTLIVRFPHIVFVGALVQIRLRNRILFGTARRCVAKDSEYEIEIEKQEIY